MRPIDNRIVTLLLAALILPAGPAPGGSAGQASSGGSELDQALRRMESAGKAFRSFSAGFMQRKYTSVLREFDSPESGEFAYARAADGSALLRQEVVKPGSRILTIKGGTAVIFQPALKQAQVVSLGKNKDKAEYLALGLGQSPARLRETFDLECAGSEKVAEDSCWILVLKPKNKSAAAFFTSITLWLKKSSGIPVQQKLQEPNGDYLLVAFSGEKLNPKIPASKFEQKLPQGVEVIRIQ